MFKNLLEIFNRKLSINVFKVTFALLSSKLKCHLTVGGTFFTLFILKNERFIIFPKLLLKKCLLIINVGTRKPFFFSQEKM